MKAALGSLVTGLQGYGAEVFSVNVYSFRLEIVNFTILHPPKKSEWRILSINIFTSSTSH